jgi:hypothetical protein
MGIPSPPHQYTTQAVLGIVRIRIHDTVEENRVDTVLDNPYKTKIIVSEAKKIKSDKLLDARRLLSDLLRADLIYKSYVPKQEDTDKRRLVEHRITNTI